MTKTPSVVDAMESKSLFRPWFRRPLLQASTWEAWKTFLRCLFALPMDDDDAVVYRKHTKRELRPNQPFKEAWVCVGRRGGKSLIASLVAVYLACFRDYSSYLQPGEIGTVMVIAADRSQARTVLRYVKGFLEVPILRRLVIGETSDSIELSNRIAIEIHTCSFRSVRGYTLVAVIADEVAYWRSEESANPDSEVIGAVRPGLTTLPNSLLLCISSPYARRGMLWQTYDRYFAKDDANLLVWQSDSKSMNPTLPDSVIDRALEEDESAASAEWLAEFRRDIESFVCREAVDACIVAGRIEIPPVEDISYRAFCDPSGGSADSFTLAVAHQDPSGKAVLDCVRERKPPFSPEAVVKEFADLLVLYGITEVEGDRYAGEWPREQFRKAGIGYTVAENTKSEIYLSTLPLLNSQRVELLDNPRLIAQLMGLERRTSRMGRDTIDHQPAGHDDLVNSACGALLACQQTTAHLATDAAFFSHERTGYFAEDPVQTGVGSLWPEEF